MRNSTFLWIEAAKILSTNPRALVNCPECKGNNLHVKDSRSSTDSSVIEREIFCPLCGARNYLILVRPFYREESIENM